MISKETLAEKIEKLEQKEFNMEINDKNMYLDVKKNGQDFHFFPVKRKIYKKMVKKA